MRFIQYFLFFVFSAVSIRGYSNDSTRTWKDIEKRISKKIIRDGGIRPTIEKKFFKDVEVVDARPDTLRLGMYSTTYSIPYQLVSESSIRHVIKEKLGNGIDGETALVVLKDLWLNELKEKEYKKDTEVAKSKPQPTAKLTLRADVFILQNDQYSALARIDTLILEKQSLGSTYNNLLEKALEVIHRKMVIAVSENKFKTKTKLTKDFVINSYASRFKTNVLTDTVLKRGVYFSYEDFKNNTPANINFKVSSSGGSYVLYLIENGAEILERNVWGVNDGKNIYIVQDSRLHPLYRNHNAFYWMGNKKVSVNNYNVPVYVPYSGSMMMVPLSTGGMHSEFGRTPLLLNPETGKEY